MEEDDVGPQDAPICGFDLGPLLSWLNCVPNEPPPVKKTTTRLPPLEGENGKRLLTQPRHEEDVVVGEAVAEGTLT